MDDQRVALFVGAIRESVSNFIRRSCQRSDRATFERSSSSRQVAFTAVLVCSLKIRVKSDAAEFFDSGWAMR